MKRGAAILLCLAALSVRTSALAADEGRFDAQIFRPLAAPRDLVMVPKSEVIGHLSPVAGLYWDIALDPLALVVGGTGRTLDVVGARLQVTPLLGVGLFNTLELTAAIPIVAWQTSDNLRRIGTEGEIKSSPHVGDIRLQTKVALPLFNRKEDVKSGFGMAIAGNINLPTGDPLAFSSDGGISGGAQLIVDYRFNIGLLLASNLGVWIRPEHQFAGVKIGDMAQFGLAAEMYVVQRWGLSVVGEVYGYPALSKYPDDATQIPAEVLLGLRWQTRQGITLTVGGSFGAACGFGAPAFRLFNNVTWQPKSSTEQREINRILERDSADPDQDGLLAPEDRCPDVAGVAQNHGCPDQDRDNDGAIGSEDQCPDLAAGLGGSEGCPPARVDGDVIATFEPITFEPESTELSDRAKFILESVRRVLRDTPTIRWVRVEVHTDARESDTPTDNLSHIRASRIALWMLYNGIDEGRVTALGYGHTQPEADDADCLEPDELLPMDCRVAMRMNRRVVFRIKRWGAPATRGLFGIEQATVLPTRNADGALRQVGDLPGCRPYSRGNEGPIPCVLPMKPVVVTQDRVLEDAKKAEGMLPTGSTKSLPSGGVLPKEDGALPAPPE